MPSAPEHNRNDELLPASKTVFEFDGRYAETDGRTFAPGQMELEGHHRGRHVESNLRSGAATWLFMGVAVVVVLGTVALMAGGRGQDTAAIPASASAPTETKREEPASAPTPSPEPAAEPAPVAAPVPEVAKAEPAATEPTPAKPATPKPKKKSTPSADTKTPAEPKPTETKPTETKATPVKLVPKKPPREDEGGFDNLPKPPG